MSIFTSKSRRLGKQFIPMAELVNEYRNLLWGAVFLIITGGYAFTGMALVSVQREIGRNALAIQILDRDVRAIKDVQIKALAEREAQFKDIYRRVDELQARTRR